jgi:hypothetical protein
VSKGGRTNGVQIFRTRFVPPELTLMLSPQLLTEGVGLALRL